MPAATAVTEKQAAAARPPESTATEQHPIVTEAVSKAFGDHTVVDRVSLSVRRGEIFGLIGPSGSGKTTLLKLMVGQAVPTRGAVRVLGVEPRDFSTRDREAIGYVPQNFILYPSLTVEQNAKFVAGLYGMGMFKRRKRIRQTLRMLDLWDARGRLSRDISGGMKRRLMLACALLHSPSLLFVDEPTAGLDPLLRATVWEHLRHLGRLGVTIFMTTQHLDEAALCDRVAFMREGRIIAIGAPDELREQAIGGHALDIETPLFQRADAEALYQLPGVRNVSVVGLGKVRVVVDDVATTTAPVSAMLSERGVEVTAMRPNEPTFDEVFIALVGASEEEQQ